MNAINTINPQFINDINGMKSLVVLPINEFDLIIEELKKWENIRLYDDTKRKEDDFWKEYANSISGEALRQKMYKNIDSWQWNEK